MYENCQNALPELAEVDVFDTDPANAEIVNWKRRVVTYIATYEEQRGVPGDHRRSISGSPAIAPQRRTPSPALPSGPTAGLSSASDDNFVSVTSALNEEDWIDVKEESAEKSNEWMDVKMDELNLGGNTMNQLQAKKGIDGYIERSQEVKRGDGGDTMRQEMPEPDADVLPDEVMPKIKIHEVKSDVRYGATLEVSLTCTESNYRETVDSVLSALVNRTTMHQDPAAATQPGFAEGDVSGKREDTTQVTGFVQGAGAANLTADGCADAERIWTAAENAGRVWILIENGDSKVLSERDEEFEKAEEAREKAKEERRKLRAEGLRFYA